MIIIMFLSLRHKFIVKYKTAFYSFYLPVAAAMYMVSYSVKRLYVLKLYVIYSCSKIISILLVYYY